MRLLAKTTDVPWSLNQINSLTQRSRSPSGSSRKPHGDVFWLIILIVCMNKAPITQDPRNHSQPPRQLVMVSAVVCTKRMHLSYVLEKPTNQQFLTNLNADFSPKLYPCGKRYFKPSTLGLPLENGFTVRTIDERLPTPDYPLKVHYLCYFFISHRALLF